MLLHPASSLLFFFVFGYNKNKNKNNLPLATVLAILLYYRIDAESESRYELIHFSALAETGPGLSMRLYSSYIIIGERI